MSVVAVVVDDVDVVVKGHGGVAALSTVGWFGIARVVIGVSDTTGDRRLRW